MIGLGIVGGIVAWIGLVIWLVRVKPCEPHKLRELDRDWHRGK